jgi:lipoprotein-anchoring transpeptidase ErfK/SrfK
MTLKRVLLQSAAVLAAAVMLALSAGLVWAAADDYATRDVVPAGVTVADVSLAGMTAPEARAAIEDAVVKPLMGPVHISADGYSAEVDPAQYLDVDLDAAVADAFEATRNSTIAQRVYRVLLEEPVRTVVKPRITLDSEGVADLARSIAEKVDQNAVDADVGLVSGAVQIKSSKPGRQLDQEAAVKLVSEALMSSQPSVDLAVHAVEPSVSEDDLGRWVVIRLASRTLELWDDTSLSRRYPIAIGAEGYGTPKGEWKITLKRYLPTWVNPGSDWAKTMPAKIGPGPANPLGTRALNLNASGIRIHGTPNEASIGTAASHGCIRMKRSDIEQLYDLVQVGTPVFVVER